MPNLFKGEGRFMKPNPQFVGQLQGLTIAPLRSFVCETTLSFSEINSVT